ncbi:MAG TPA: porin [bacterium]
MLALVMGVGLAAPGASAATVEELERQVEAQGKLISELQRQVHALHQTRGAQPEGAAAADESAPSTWPERAQEFSRQGASPALGGVGTKPFLVDFGKRAYLGGYADLEYKDSESGNAAFRQHRLIPFIYADVSERVKFATEIEFEYGGPDNNASDGEVKVEFATIDYLLTEAANLRAGIVLSPLGKLNAVHDSPLQDLTERPLVNQFIIPTTLSEAGAGLFGSFAPTDLSQVSYEAYLVNGFSGLTGESAANVMISRASGLRSARGSQKSDLNDEPALVGRVAVSPFLGLEVGGSTHIGAYDTRGDNMLGIYVLDATWQHGPFELLAEGAYAAIEKNALADSLGVPDDLYGYYVQGNYHFMPQALRSWAPKVFTDESIFTLVNRWDWVNLDGNRTQRYTLGLNFRPREETVLKTDFQFNEESGLLDSIDDNAFLVSVATYF